MNRTETRALRALRATHFALGAGVFGTWLGCNSVERDAPPRHSASASSAVAPAPSRPAPSASPAATPSTPEASERAAPSSPARVAFVVAAIGDSLTDRRSHGGGYLEYLKTQCPAIQIDNFAKGGSMVNQMRRGFEAQVGGSGKRYTHLVVFGGVNDLYSDLTAFRTPQKIEQDLGFMYDWGHAHGLKVVAFTVSPWGGFSRYYNPTRAAATRTLNAWIREQASQGRVDWVVDAFGLLSCGDAEVLCERISPPFRDGLHFGPEGHQILGQALFQSAFSDCQ